MKLAEPDIEEIAVAMHENDEMFQTFIELSEFFNSSNNNVVVGTEGNINKYDVEIREIEQKVFGDEMKDQEQQENYVLRDINETLVLNQQDKDESNQQLKRGSVETQKIYDGRLVLEASKEAESSYLFKTNSLLMNAGTTPNEKVVSIGEINDYSRDQEEFLDYSSTNYQQIGRAHV